MTARRLAAVVGFEALTLVVASSLHLASGATDAGIPEAVICVVLVVGALQLVRRGAAAASVAFGTVAFAILGFLVGLSATLHDGTAVELAYHATMLPILLATVVAAWRLRPPKGDSPRDVSRLNGAAG